MAINKPSFVDTTYIASTPEKVWAALRDPEMTKAKTLLETSRPLPGTEKRWGS